MQTATDIVARKSGSSNDTFLRHHLMAVAREISSLSTSMIVDFLDCHAEAVCLSTIVEQEFAYASGVYPNRSTKIRKGACSPIILPSWSAAVLFRRVVRILIHDVIRNANSEKSWSVRLRARNSVVRLGIDGGGSCSESDLMSRVCNPRRLKSLLAALGAEIEDAPNGITLSVPIRNVQSNLSSAGSPA
jgi:hypothetical protein